MTILKDETISKIDVNSIKKFKADLRIGEFGRERAAFYFDGLKTYQSIWSKRVPLESVNGLMQLLYAITYPNATTNDMETAVVKDGNI